MRFELDTQKTEDPTNVSFLGINNEQDAEEYAKKAADNYSKNLLNKGISGYEVSPEYYYGSDNV
jgi:hypothetical protein